VRVVILSYDSVAVSNHPDPDVIRGMLDRSRKLASPFGGPWLLRNFYRRGASGEPVFCHSARDARNEFTGRTGQLEPPVSEARGRRDFRALSSSARPAPSTCAPKHSPTAKMTAHALTEKTPPFSVCFTPPKAALERKARMRM
jgi:hypothetical protein